MGHLRCWLKSGEEALVLLGAKEGEKLWCYCHEGCTRARGEVLVLMGAMAWLQKALILVRARGKSSAVGDSQRRKLWCWWELGGRR